MSPTIVLAGDAFYTEGWSEDRGNEGLSQGRNFLERKKIIRRHQGECLHMLSL